MTSQHGPVGRTVAGVRAAWRARFLAGAERLDDVTRGACLVLAPHPDDETLGCAGLVVRKLEAGARVRVVVVTDGRHRSRAGGDADLAAVRAAEARSAMAVLGLPAEELVLLGFANGELGQHLPELREALQAQVEQVQPDLVLVTSRDDAHVDHRALNAAARSVHDGGGLPGELWEYPVWAWRAWPWPSPRRGVRGAVHLLLDPVALLRRHRVALPLGDRNERKRDAIACYASQFGPSGDAARDAAGRRLLAALPADVEVFLPVASGRAAVGVLNLHCDLRLGGGQVHVLRHLEHLDDGFRHVVAYVTPPADMHETFEAAGLRPIALDARGGVDLVRVVMRLVRVIRTDRIDVVHTNTRPDRLVGQLAALMTRRPVVDTLRSEFAARRHRVPGRRPPRIERLRLAVEDLLRDLTVRQVVAISEDVAATWRASVSGTRAARIPVTVVHAGAPFDEFAPGRVDRARVRARFGVPAGAPLLLTVARLDRGKGLAHLVAAVADLRARGLDVHSVVAGEGPYRAELEHLVAASGLQDVVHLPGRRTDVADLLGAGDVFVFPSLSEGFGVAVLEAVAAGLPVVAFDLPVFAETVRHEETGLLVPLGDERALADAVAALVADPGRARELGRRGRELAAERFDVARCATRLGEVYRAAARAG